MVNFFYLLIIIIEIPVRRSARLPIAWPLLPFAIEAMDCPYGFSFLEYKSRNETRGLPSLVLLLPSLPVG